MDSLTQRPSAAANLVYRADPRTLPGWDDTARQLGGTVFHTAAWAGVLADTYGYQPVYHVLGAPEVAILPLMEINSWLTGRRGVSLPFTDECGALGANADSFRRLFDAAVAFGRQRGWKYLECRGTPHLLPDAPPSLSFFGHRLDLRGTETELLARFDSANRRAIRKAQQSGVTVEFAATAEAMRTFYGLMRLTRKRHGLPPQPRKFFEAIQQQVLAPGHGTVAVARHNGTPVAGAVYLHSGTTVLYKFGASDERFQQVRGNNLVMAEAMRWHAARGFTTLDFGRTSVGNEGLRRFKLSWGAQEHTARYIKYHLRANAFVADRDQSSGWHTRVFGALPLPLSALAGRLLYKHIG